MNSYSDDAPARHRGVVAFPTQAGCCYQAFKEAPILLPQPLPATGAPLSRADQVRQAARAGNTQRAYLGHWNRFRSWAREQGLDLPEGLETALCDYLVHLAWEGRRMATIRQARTAISKGAQLAGWPRPYGLDVAETMLGLSHILKGPQKQAAPSAPRLCRRSAPPPSPAAAPGAVIPRRQSVPSAAALSTALASVMRDALLRVSEVAALRWGDVELVGNGSGRIRIPESKTDQEAVQI